MSPARQMQLEQEGGLAIVGTHFGKGFIRDGCVHPQVVELLTGLSQRPGWFRPVSTLLDYVVGVQGEIPLLAGYELFRLEGLWFWHSIRGRKQASKLRSHRGAVSATRDRAPRRAIRLSVLPGRFGRVRAGHGRRPDVVRCMRAVQRHACNIGPHRPVLDLHPLEPLWP